MISDLSTEPPADVLTQLKTGDRRLLARVLTLAESTKSEHITWLDKLFSFIDNSAAPPYRIAFSGAPGVGKSTLIDAIGKEALGAGHHLAVLAVDPSSARSGGSFLADKTRMIGLTTDSRAFVRPSPSRTQLGGVTAALSDSIVLCGLAGFDLVFVETVGVGQGEVDARDCVDSFALVLTPRAGDELQAMKHGINEVADWVLINKSDSDPSGAEQVKQAYSGALAQRHPGDRAQVRIISASTHSGISEFWSDLSLNIASCSEQERSSAEKVRRRRLFVRLAKRELARRLEQQPELRASLQSVEDQVAQGTRSLRQGVREVGDQLDAWLTRPTTHSKLVSFED